MMKGIWFCILVVWPLPTPAAVLSPTCQKMYRQRDFSALRFQNCRVRQAGFFELQRLDLKDCRLLHEGTGDLRTLLGCLRFLSRESEQGLTSRESQTLYRELDGLCPLFVKKNQNMDPMAGFDIHWHPSLPSHRCEASLLGAASQAIDKKLSENPIQAWSFFRKIMARWHPRGDWIEKATKQLSTRKFGPKLEQ